MGYTNNNVPIKNLDRLNVIIKEWCNSINDKKETLSLESTFKDVADFLNYFAAFEYRHKIKRNSPDYKLTLELWIEEIETKLDIENKDPTYLFGDQNGFRNILFNSSINQQFNFETFAYLKTVKVEKCCLKDVKEYLFTSAWNGYDWIEEEDNLDIIFRGDLLEKIAKGFVYAHKLPELKKELSGLSKGQNEIQKNINENPEPMPEYQYKTKAQNIAWLHELGVLTTIMDLCKNGETINPNRAANIIHSFTGIDAETLRKCLEAIYQPGANPKNNPLINPKNKLFVADMAAKFKLNKENKPQ